MLELSGERVGVAAEVLSIESNAGMAEYPGPGPRAPRLVETIAARPRDKIIPTRGRDTPGAVLSRLGALEERLDVRRHATPRHVQRRVAGNGAHAGRRAGAEESADGVGATAAGREHQRRVSAARR